MSIRSAVTCWTCQRAFSAVLALTASRKRASFGLRSVGAWMRIAARASRGAGRGSGIAADDRSARTSGVRVVEQFGVRAADGDVAPDPDDALRAERGELVVHEGRRAF